VIFVSADIVTPSPMGRILDDPDEWLRQGWWSLGDEFDIGLGTFQYWSPKHYLDFDHNVWSCTPSQDPGVGLNFTATATRIRWFVASGGVAHLHVLGF
jgi:hypothetical protein